MSSSGLGEAGRLQISIELDVKQAFLRAGQPCRASMRITNHSDSRLDGCKVVLLDGEDVTGTLDLGEVSTSFDEVFDISINVKERLVRELEKRQLAGIVIASLPDGKPRQIKNPLGTYLVLPDSPPYVPVGVPTNQSFQGRGALYKDVHHMLFEQKLPAVYLESPGHLGKTSFVMNLDRQGLFSGIDIVVLEADHRPALEVPSASHRGLAEQIAQAVFHGGNINGDNTSAGLVELLTKHNKILRREERFLLIAIDTLELWLKEAVTSETHRSRMQNIRNILAGRPSSETERVKWLFCGQWSFNRDWQEVWNVDLTARRAYSTSKKLATLDEEGGRQVVSVPVLGLFQFDEKAYARIRDLTGWHPMIIQILCNSLYLQQTEIATTVPWQVSEGAVSQAAESPLVVEQVRNVWERTVESLHGSPLMIDVFRAIRDQKGEPVSETRIWTSLSSISTKYPTDEIATIASALGGEDADRRRTLQTLLPKILEYLVGLGLLALVGGAPARYRVASELLGRYIGTLHAGSR